MATTAELRILQDLATDGTPKIFSKNRKNKFFSQNLYSRCQRNSLIQKLSQLKQYKVRQLEKCCSNQLTELLNQTTNYIHRYYTLALIVEVYIQVVTHYEDLLSQATGIEALESTCIENHFKFFYFKGVLKMMQSRIDSLTTAVDRYIVQSHSYTVILAASFPFLESVTRSLILIRKQSQGQHNLLDCRLINYILINCKILMLVYQAACDLLRKVIRMLYLMKRIKTQMQGGVKEITKVAQTFNEIGIKYM